jgi:hypothetical protein
MENLKSIIQILLWIAIPVIVVSSLITIILHYRRKKNADEPDNASDTESVKSNSAKIKQEEVIKKENKNMSKEYVAEIEKNKEVIAHLKSEFAFLEKKYEKLKNTPQQTSDNTSAINANNDELNRKLKETELKVETLNQLFSQYEIKDGEQAKMIAALKRENAVLKDQSLASTGDSSESNDLKNLLVAAEKKYSSLKSELDHQLSLKSNDISQLKLENEKLRLQAIDLSQQVQTASNQNSQAINKEDYEDLLEQNSTLIKKVSEYAYFEDLMNEKKQQIHFLEKQVEQRVKQAHETEQMYDQQLKKAAFHTSEVDSLKKEYEEVSTKLAEQCKMNNNHIIELEKITGELQLQKSSLLEKQYLIDGLETNLRSEKEASEIIKKLSLTDKNIIMELTKQTDEQQRKIEELEGKLKVSSQLLARIYSDLGKSFASIFSEEINVLPESVKFKELNGTYTSVYEAEPVRASANGVNNNHK